ncbi:MAG: hypothetical protein IKH18_04210 [Clostridia bacterium]|nr:hypothetical protein [Clostridia bacterium]
MALNQISVLVDNSQGILAGVTNELANAGVNLRALSIADTERFGILRMIVSDNKLATSVLRAKGLVVKETEVIGVKIGDQPGKLAEALTVLNLAGINLEYLYAFCARTQKHAYMVIRVADNDAAEKALTAAGFHMIEDTDIAKL